MPLISPKLWVQLSSKYNLMLICAPQIAAPVLHVNGDFPEAVAQAADIAFQYRAFFRKDIILDLVSYRRMGQ